MEKNSTEVFEIRVKEISGQYMIEATGPEGISVPPQPFSWYSVMACNRVVRELVEQDLSIEALNELGMALYRALFIPPISEAIAFARGKDRSGGNLHFQIRVEPLLLAALPWKYLTKIIEDLSIFEIVYPQSSEGQFVESLQALLQVILAKEHTLGNNPRKFISEEDRLFLALVDDVPFSMWASKGSDDDFEIVLWNRGAEKLYGHKKEDALGKNFIELFVSREERADAATDCDSILEGEVFTNFLAEDVMQDGTTRVMLTNCFRIWDEQEKRYLQAEIGVNVSELEKSEQKLRSLRELAIRQQAASERMQLLDRLRKITNYITSSLQEEIKVESILKLVVNSVDELIEEDTVSKVWLFSGKVRGNEERADICVVNDIKSPFISDFQFSIDTLRPYMLDNPVPVFWDKQHQLVQSCANFNNDLIQGSNVSVAILPLMSQAKLIGILAVQLQSNYVFSEEIEEVLRLFAEQAVIAVENSRLIEDLRELNQMVAEKQEVITRSIIAVDFIHRMNNLAGPILGWIGLIRELVNTDDPRDQKILEYVSEIETDAKNLTDAAQKLRAPLEMQKIDLNFMLKAIIRNIEILHPEVELHSSFQSDLLPVWAVYSQLQDAIRNIVMNSLEAMSYKGNLKLSTRNVASSRVEIIVEDTGPGIPEEIRKHIFQIGHTTKSTGSGYGLWRTKHVIQELGGSIDFRSELGTGTTFTILLPVYHT